MPPRCLRSQFVIRLFTKIVSTGLYAAERNADSQCTQDCTCASRHTQDKVVTQALHVGNDDLLLDIGGQRLDDRHRGGNGSSDVFRQVIGQVALDTVREDCARNRNTNDTTN
jgi:hypothetical protein